MLDRVVTDLVQIRLLGDKKRTENERFRRHLKAHNHSDRILRRLAEQVESEIDCTACANCCRVATARVTARDVERLARHFRLSVPRVLDQFCVESEEEGAILRRTAERGCVFLDGNTCTVYDARPDSCRRFPHLVRGNGSIASRLWEMTDRACYCPIVYNSLEAFKRETGFRY